MGCWANTRSVREAWPARRSRRTPPGASSWRRLCCTSELPTTPPATVVRRTTRARRLGGRARLRQAAAQVRVFEHLASAARAGKRPLLTGVGSVGKINPVPLFESSDKPWAVGLGLTIPVFTGGLVEGQVEEARRNANAARDNLAELANTVRQQVTGAVANLAAAEESVRLAE